MVIGGEEEMAKVVAQPASSERSAGTNNATIRAVTTMFSGQRCIARRGRRIGVLIWPVKNGEPVEPAGASAASPHGDARESRAGRSGDHGDSRAVRAGPARVVAKLEGDGDRVADHHRLFVDGA